MLQYLAFKFYYHIKFFQIKVFMEIHFSNEVYCGVTCFLQSRHETEMSSYKIAFSESLYIMNVGDECAFAGYEGVSCLMLRFIYEVHDKFPFVELGFAANAVIVLISMFNS